MKTAVGEMHKTWIVGEIYMPRGQMKNWVAEILFMLINIAKVI